MGNHNGDLAGGLSHEEIATASGAREGQQTEAEEWHASAGKGVNPVSYSPERPEGDAIPTVSRGPVTLSMSVISAFGLCLLLDWCKTPTKTPAWEQLKANLCQVSLKKEADK